VKIRIPILIVLTSLLSVLLFFQNCGETHNFSAAEIPSSTQLSDIPTAQTDFSTEGDSEGELQKLEVTLDPQIRMIEGVLNVFVLLDDSISNRENIENMKTGIRKLIQKLEGKNVRIEVFTTGDLRHSFSHLKSKGFLQSQSSSAIDYRFGVLKKTTKQNQSTQDSSVTIREESFQYEARQALAVYESKQPSGLNDFFNKIDQHLELMANVTQSTQNTSPRYFCDLAAYFDQQIQDLNKVRKDRYAFIVVSDEDTSIQSACLKTSEKEIHRKKTGERVQPARVIAAHYKARVELEMREVREGGVINWIKSTRTFTSQCNSVSGVLDSWLKRNTQFRITSNTLSGCQESFHAERTIPEKTVSVFSTIKDTEDKNHFFGAESPEDLTKAIHRLISPSRIFFASFVVQESDATDNDDQTVGHNHKKIAQMLSGSENSVSYSIKETNYDDLVNRISFFEYITGRNEFRLPANFSQMKLEKLIILDSGGEKMSLELNFKQDGDVITVLDGDVDLSLGARLDLTLVN
jgi:hypothetical protein